VEGVQQHASCGELTAEVNSENTHNISFTVIPPRLHRTKYDAIVIGSGPNGMAAAITLAREKHSVLVIEGQQRIGGAASSEESTLPGFLHDVGSAVHPMAVSSPFFRELPLADHGLQWIHPPAPAAHPLDDGTAVVLHRSIEQTAATLGEDGPRYKRMMDSLLADWPQIQPFLFAATRLPHHPVAAMLFALRGLGSASSLAHSFRAERARALIAGLGAHSVLPLEQTPSAAFALILAISAHTVGWPIPHGGAQRITDALASYLRTLGGEIVVGWKIESLTELPPAQAIFCDVTPRQLLRIAGSRLTSSYRKRLARYHYGPGVCKVDWALNGPVPWTAPECRCAGTVHIGGTLDEIAASERAPAEGRCAERPFVLVSQPTLFDQTRAPEGKHIAWAYCHVPNGSRFNMADRSEEQIERFAPGFRGVILKRSVKLTADLEAQNPNLVGGDIVGGSNELGQIFARPTWRTYRTSLRGLYLCSASTPPGGGVHGLSGYMAGRAALRDMF
jgi:phytoene dehydrogenase-like protein